MIKFYNIILLVNLISLDCKAFNIHYISKEFKALQKFCSVFVFRLFLQTIVKETKTHKGMRQETLKLFKTIISSFFLLVSLCGCYAVLEIRTQLPPFPLQLAYLFQMEIAGVFLSPVSPVFQTVETVSIVLKFNQRKFGFCSNGFSLIRIYGIILIT